MLNFDSQMSAICPPTWPIIADNLQSRVLTTNPVDSLSAAMLGGAQGRRCVGVGLDATGESANLVEDGFRRTPEV